MTKDRSEILQGTLDLTVLKTLDAMGPLHGYGIARRILPATLHKWTAFDSLR
jgi:PadR family transcriptional regulator, regulatory protein PadR